MDNGMESMLDMYLFETNSMIEQLDAILLEAERAGDFTSEDVNEIFRIMHTVKGSSAMMQFSSLMTIAHSVEDLFYCIRQQGLDASHKGELFDLMFKSCDFLKSQVGCIENGQPLAEDIGAFSDEINRLLKKINKSDAGGAAESAESGDFAVRVFFDEGCGMENLRSFMLVTSVGEVCENFTFTPADVETNPETAAAIIEDGFTLHFSSEADLNAALTVIKGVLNIRTYEVLQPGAAPTKTEDKPPENVDAPPPKANESDAAKAAPAQPVPAASHPAAKQSLISVNLAKLDSLMAIVGEIVITESMVTASPDIQGVKLDNFTKSARQLRKLTGELQDIVMSIRMVPVSGVFQKMNRIVRDVGRELGKDVKLTIIGEETEVDKTIVDSIGDPIMHMVRNAMDHGIEENANDRIARGKDPQGEIILQATNTGSEVLISIRDNGRGVNLERVLEKARENGLLTKPESEYTKKEILQLLLLPGFSTKSEVTEYSGRGVGMDVVKKNIEKVGGTVVMSSEAGEGTCTEFKIPLTLAIVEGMEIAVGGSIFTVPIMNIRQSFKVKKEDIVYDTGKGEMLQQMGKFYPVVRVHELYDIENAQTDIEKGIIIWVEAGDKSYCLFVDELLGEQQVVVKPLPAYLNNFKVKDAGIAGLTILGDGNISIILDVLNLYDTPAAL